MNDIESEALDDPYYVWRALREGRITINQARIALGLWPIGGGDRLTEPLHAKSPRRVPYRVSKEEA